MKGAFIALLGLLVAVPAAAQTTIQATDPSTHTTAPEIGDVVNHAIRMICINPVSHLAESCAGTGGGGGGNVVITDPGAVNQMTVNASGQAAVFCANCSGSGVSATDAATYTATSSLFAPIGGYFKTSVDSLTTGQSGAVALTATRAFHVSLFDNAGNALLGQQTAANSMPVILPSATITTLTPPAAITNFANETGGNLAAIKTDVDKIPAQGQALAAASTPVVLPATQITTLTPPAAITNFANETGGNLAAIKADVDKIPSQGQALAAASMPVVLTAAQVTTLTPLTTVAVTNVGTFPTQSAVTAASGSIASGAVASGAVASGAYASGSISDGAEVTLGAKADAKSTATDTTSITAMQVLKEISFMEQTPASRAVTNAGTFATQSAVTAASGSIASGAIASGAIASGAVASGAVASGAFASGSISDGAEVTLGSKADAKSTATDTTAITVMQVLKEISAVTQAPPSQAPTPSSASGDAFTECVILSAASTNSTNCKASAGNFISYELFNTTTTVYYLRLYNASGAPTCSSATGFIRSIPIPPASAAGGVGGVVSNNTIGVQYATGIAYCLTGGSSSTDATNAATGVFGSLKVK